MPTNTYLNVVLTVIAVALSVIAGNQLLNPAQAQVEVGCGDRDKPCYSIIVSGNGGEEMDVEGGALLAFESMSINILSELEAIKNELKRGD